jgi:hypothetical protein
MKEDKQKIIFRKGSNKPMKITHAHTSGVESMKHVSIKFMKDIFGLKQGDYFITDEARLIDFTDFGSGDITPIIINIKKSYCIDVSGVPNGNLVAIFKMINEQLSSMHNKPIKALSCSGTKARKKYNN